MAKAKIARKSTSIDMTPMVDLAFLLITFFMLTVKFRPQEAVEVLIPSSIAKTPLPPNNMLNILIGPDGRVFMGVSDPNTRSKMIEMVAAEKGLSFTAEEIKKFSLVEQIGVPIASLKPFLKLDSEQRTVAVKKGKGIPVDSTNNELQVWVLNARKANKDLRIAIKADQKTPYPAIRDVVQTLKKQRANRFNLITSQEANTDAGAKSN